MFDLDSARKAGYSDNDIAEGLAKEQGVDFAAAQKAGYSATDMLPSLVTGAAPKPGIISRAVNAIGDAYDSGVKAYQDYNSVTSLPTVRTSPVVSKSISLKDVADGANLDDITNKNDHGDYDAPRSLPEILGDGATRTSVNVFGGLAGGLAKSAAAIDDVLGDKKAAEMRDQQAKNWQGVMDENGGDTPLGKVLAGVGGILPALVVPEAKALQLVSNAGMFGVPAFRDTLNAELEKGEGFGAALMHASTAFGINMAMPALAKGGSVSLNKLVNTQGLGGVANAAAGFGKQAVLGAGLSVVNSVSDKVIDNAFGEKNDNDYINPEDMGVQAATFGVIGSKHIFKEARNPVNNLGYELNNSVNNGKFDQNSINNEVLNSLNPNSVDARSINPSETVKPNVDPLAQKPIDKEVFNKTTNDLNTLRPINPVQQKTTGDEVDSVMQAPDLEASIKAADEISSAKPTDNTSSAPIDESPSATSDDILKMSQQERDNWADTAHPDEMLDKIASITDDKARTDFINSLNMEGIDRQSLHVAVEDTINNDPRYKLKDDQPKVYLTRLGAEYAKARNNLTGMDIVDSPDGNGYMLYPKESIPTKAERDDAEQRVEDLNAANARGGVKGVVLSDNAAPAFGIARTLAKVFGVKAHVVSESDQFNGVAHNGQIFLSKNSNLPALAVTGHEVQHTLEKSNPDLYNKMSDLVTDYLHDHAVTDRKVNEDRLTPKDANGNMPNDGISHDGAKREVIADLNGEMWMDHRFWREMIQRDLNLFRQVAYHFAEVTTKAIEALNGQRVEAAKYVKDVDAVRKIMAQTWAEHLQSNPDAGDMNDLSFARKSVKDSADEEDQRGLIVGAKPGEFGWTYDKPGESSPYQAPVAKAADQAKLGEHVFKILSARGAKDFILEHFGISDIKIIRTNGSWQGKPEVSFIIRGNGSFEQMDALGKFLGFVQAQDMAITTEAIANAHPDTDVQPALLISDNKVLSADDRAKVIDAAKKEGLDYTITADGRSVKFSYGPWLGHTQTEFYDKVESIQKAVGFKEILTVETRAKANFADDGAYNDEIRRLKSVLPSEGDSDGATGSSDLFRRAADHFILPYARAVAGEGYRFSPEKFGERFGLNESEIDHLRDGLYPSNGKKLSTAGIMSGEEELQVDRSKPGNKASVTDVLSALQNRAARIGQIDIKDRSVRAVKLLANAIADEVVHHINNSTKSAIGWYDAALKRAMHRYDSVFPELKSDPNKSLLFKAILGITSQGADVHTNSINASRVYSIVRGDTKTLSDAVEQLKGTFGKQTTVIEGNLLKLESMLNKNGYDTMRELFNTKRTVSEWNSKLRQDPRLKWAGLEVSGQADQKVTGWSMFGPKIGSFINNLHGDYSTLTADLWFSRTWNRMLGFSFIHTPARENDVYQNFKSALLNDHLPAEGKSLKYDQQMRGSWGDDLSNEDRESIVNDPDKMLSIAQDIESKFRKDGYKKGSDVYRAAKTWVELREGSQDAPRTDTERAMQQDTVEKAQKLIKLRTGQTISVADIQAALWFHEKELFSKFGAATDKSKPADYEDAAKNTIDKIKNGTLFKDEEELPKVKGRRAETIDENGNLLTDYKPQFSLKDDDGKKLTAVFGTLMRELGDTVFRYPRSDSDNLKTISNEVSRGKTILSDVSLWETRNPGETMQRLEIRVPTPEGIDKSMDAFVSKLGNDVWINVAGFKKGNEGALVYSIVGNWAHNNGYRFIGDPAGLSPAALTRRLQNMLSLSLKFGDTSFVKPHQRQIDKLADYGFKWTEGDDQKNLQSMLYTTYNLMSKMAPELRDVEYNFRTNKFEEDGKRFTDEDFLRAASKLHELSVPGAPGSGTLKIGATIGTIVRGMENAPMGESSESVASSFLWHIHSNRMAGAGSEDLRSIGRTDLSALTEGQHETGLDNTLYSRKQEDTPEFKEWFGDSKVVDAEGKPLVVYHGTPDGNFNEFDSSKIADGAMMSQQGAGFYFTDKANANQYTKSVNKRASGDKKLFDVYLNLKNPLEVTPRSGNIPLDSFKKVLMDGDYPWFFSNWVPFETGASADLSKEAKVDAYLDYQTRGGKDEEYDSKILSNLTRAYKDKGLLLESMKRNLNADGVDFKDSHGHIYVAWDANQIKSATGNNGDFSKDNNDIRYSLKDSAIEHAKSFMDDMRESDIVRNAKMMIIPMSTGSMAAKSAAQKFANAVRVANNQWQSVDQYIVTHFNKTQREDMWNAADRESVLLQEGKSTVGQGLDTLPADQRAVMETMHKYSQELWQRAKDTGMVNGDGLKFWTPRMAVVIGMDGEFSTLSTPGKQSSSDGTGSNLYINSPFLKGRKYLHADETEDAMRNINPDAELVRDARTMPLAMARLEQAIAGRELVNQIKTIGQMSGKALTSSGMDNGFVTIDHPALTTYTPRLDKVTQPDGSVKFKTVNDENGKIIMERKPIYIDQSWEGPLRAVLSQNDGAIYRAYMLLKSKSMSAIMVSPLVHLMVIGGRALAYNSAQILSLRAFFVGNALAKDPELLNRFVGAGLVHLGGNRSTVMDVTDIARGNRKEGGWGDINESWVSKSAQLLVGTFNKQAGVSLKEKMDAVGEFYHHDLLWKQVGALQLYISKDYSDYLVSKGHPQIAADAIAVHLANRYGGAVARENMSAMTRKFLNVMLFSRSFNVGNIGAVKDTVYGLPAGLAAKIYADVGQVQGDAAMKAARGKARIGLVADLGMSMLIQSATASAIAYLVLNQTSDDIKNGYMDRLKRMAGDVSDHPLDPSSYNPMHVTPMADNEPGKENRIDLGANEIGQHEYMRMPAGKVIEDTADWLTQAPTTWDKKLSPIVGATMKAIANDRGFGHAIEDPTGGTLKHVAEGIGFVIKSQIPFDNMQTIYDMTQGVGTPLDQHKTLGFITGLTTSQGSVSGPEGAVDYATANRVKAQKSYVMDEVKRDIKYGKDDDADALLESIGFTPVEINKIIRNQESPSGRESRQMIKDFNHHATDKERELKERLSNR